jgi:hypothetical protein
MGTRRYRVMGGLMEDCMSHYKCQDLLQDHQSNAVCGILHDVAE